MALITHDTAPDLYDRLCKAVIAETRINRKPGYVIVAGQTYRVMQDSNHEQAFLAVTDQSMYESTSNVP